MKSLLKSLSIIEAVAEKQPISVGELARLLGQPKSTVQRILQAFETAGWLRSTQSDTTRWQIAPRVLTLQPLELHGGQLYAAARQSMQNLRDQFNETVYLSIPDGLNNAVLIHRMDCNQDLRTFNPIGSASPLHATANGMAIMAHLPESDIEKIIARGLKQFTVDTITDPELLRSELEIVRQRGYSVNLSCYRPTICALGSVILNAHGVPIGSVCVSMPESRYSPEHEKEWGNAVLKAAKRISPC